MSEKIIITEFITFLKDNDCYTQYRANISRKLYGTVNPLGFVYALRHKILDLYDRPPRVHSYDIGIVTNFINYAFTWSETKQGQEFWAHLDREWRKLVHNKQLYMRK